MKMLLLAAGIAAMVPAATFANPTNLVVNGSFETTTATTKGVFHNQVAGWNGGTGLDFIVFPGTADNPNKYLSVYGAFPAVSPDGGNFVEADGDRNFGTPIYQVINGLVAGTYYTVNFFQAAGQQFGLTGSTTEHWDVSLGDQTQSSSTFHLAQGGVGGWQAQTLRFSATTATEVLSFFAAGTPNGKPPIAFLDGVSLTSNAPEPAAWALMLAGFGLTGLALRRRSPMPAA